MATDIRRSDEPHDDLTRLCDVMTTALKADPEFDESIKAVIMLDNEERGGLVIFGYEEDEFSLAIAHLFGHLQAIFEANGQKLLIAPLGGRG